MGEGNHIYQLSIINYQLAIGNWQLVIGNWLVLAALFLASCDGKRLYDRFETIPQEGWERSDTVAFALPAVPAAGLYDIQLGLRTTGEYPFMTLSLIVDATVFHQADSLAPTGKEVHSYSISCRLTNNRGQSEGRGVGFYQYSFPVTSLHLDGNDSLDVRIRHAMRRETVPGISNVGIKITPNTQSGRL